MGLNEATGAISNIFAVGLTGVVAVKTLDMVEKSLKHSTKSYKKSKRKSNNYWDW